MKSAAVIMALLTVILVVEPAYGQCGGGKKGVFAKHQPFAKTPEEGLKEAKERQCPIILCVPAHG